MTFAGVLEFVREFQTLLAGGLGFIGVILVIRSQGRQNRAALDHAARKESLRLEAALKAELVMLLEAHRRIDDMLAEASGSTTINAEPMNVVFQALTPKLDHLDSDALGLIVSANAAHQSFINMLTMLGLVALSGPSHIQINGTQIGTVRQRNKAVTMRIEETLDVLASQT
jgi:hypothetical protein